MKQQIPNYLGGTRYPPFPEHLILLHDILDLLRTWVGSNNDSRRGDFHSSHHRLDAPEARRVPS